MHPARFVNLCGMDCFTNMNHFCTACIGFRRLGRGVINPLWTFKEICHSLTVENV